MHYNAIVKLFAALVAVSSPVVAELAVTAPIGTTTCTGGQSCTVSWDDNNLGVSLAQQGNCTIALYTGGAQQQTFLQPIAYPNAINVLSTAAVDFVVDPTVGPNSDQYFIRFSSTTLTQNSTTGAATTNPYLSFSAKFTLTGMTGTFNSSVLAQISSASSSPASTHAATTTTTSTVRASTTSHTTSSTHTGAGFKNTASAGLMAGVAALAGVVGLF